MYKEVHLTPLTPCLQVWGSFDPDGRGYVPVSELMRLLTSLPAPMGLKGVPGKREVHTFKPSPICRLFHLSFTYLNDAPPSS